MNQAASHSLALRQRLLLSLGAFLPRAGSFGSSFDEIYVYIKTFAF